jgi:leucyl-tRNA synthetase
MQEHMLMKYQEQVNGVAQQMIQQYGPAAIEAGVNPNDPRVMEMVLAQAAQQVAQANAAMAQMQQMQTPEAQMVALEGQRLMIEKDKVQAQIAKESVDAAMKNRELDLKEAALKVNMIKEGIKTSSNAQEKEKDRNNKKAIAALDAIMDLLKTEQIADNQKALKAADLIQEMVKDTNANGNMGRNQ